MFGFGLFAGFLRAQAVESCYATAGVNNIIRGTGEAELLGDVILNCQGGAPTPAGMPIPAENSCYSRRTRIFRGDCSPYRWAFPKR